MNERKIEITIDTGIDLEMTVLEIVREIQPMGLDLRDAANRVLTQVQQRQLGGNQHALKLIERWNCLNPSRAFPIFKSNPIPVPLPSRQEGKRHLLPRNPR